MCVGEREGGEILLEGQGDGIGEGETSTALVMFPETSKLHVLHVSFPYRTDRP